MIKLTNAPAYLTTDHPACLDGRPVLVFKATPDIAYQPKDDIITPDGELMPAAEYVRALLSQQVNQPRALANKFLGLTPPPHRPAVLDESRTVKITLKATPTLATWLKDPDNRLRLELAVRGKDAIGPKP